MESMTDYIEDVIKLGEDSSVQLSSDVSVDLGEITVEEGPNNQPFCIANINITQEEVKFEEDPYHQFSSAAYVKQEEIKVEEDPYHQLSSEVYENKEDVKIEKDPIDQPFCNAHVPQEEVMVVEDPYEQFSSAAYLKHEENMKVEEDSSDHLSSVSCVKHTDERYHAFQINIAVFCRLSGLKEKVSKYVCLSIFFINQLSVGH
jgi:hypothetical protein